MIILDIHSHKTGLETVTSLSAVALAAQYPSAELVPLEPGHLYSVGIHPWDTAAAVTPAATAMLEGMAARPEVVAIGECGLDTVKGGPMFRQINMFRAHVELSERVGKPLIIHEVKAHSGITDTFRDMRPAQAWAIHGFRYKPSVASMMTALGIYLSFGPEFNPETLKAMPAELILAETDDDAATDISSVIAAMSEVRGEDLTPVVAANSARFLHI